MSIVIKFTEAFRSQLVTKAFLSQDPQGLYLWKDDLLGVIIYPTYRRIFADVIVYIFHHKNTT